MTTTEYLVLDEAAAMYRVHPATIRVWIKERNFPAGRISPRVLRFDKAEVLAWGRRQGLSASEPVA
jgi:predicted DNA-binding transcriptional regulator AlpA